MKKCKQIRQLIFIYLIVLSCFMLIGIAGNRAVTVFTEQSPLPNRKTVIIDAGHGGVDGGTTSCTGVPESQLNLEIALRLDDLMHLLGIHTKTIRTTDISVYTEGGSIAAKKVSDLKERVRVVNQTADSLLVSIHQNYFSDSRYDGPQVFYNKAQGSDLLAKHLQNSLNTALNPDGRRTSKPAEGIYLMQHANCTSVLIECGFLSNTEEEAKLRTPDYQKKLCCCIAATISEYLANT